MWPIKKNKKMKRKKKPSQRHISKSAELDGEGGFPGFFFLRGWKPY